MSDTPTQNQRIADFAADLITQGRNPILAVIDAMQALNPQKNREPVVVHCVSDATGKEKP